MSLRRLLSSAALAPAVAALALSAAPLAAQTPVYSLPGAHTGDAAGAALGSLADLTGDGRDELIVGAPGDGTDAAGPGEVRVYSGADGAPLLRLLPLPAPHRFGAAVAGLPDVSGDGVPDFAVGAPATASGPQGRVQVRSGADGALLLQVLGTLAPTPDAFGATLATLADLDGDGAPELFIGQPGHTEDLYGQAVIRSAKTGMELFLWAGDAPGDRFGTALSTAGDVDGDGTQDLLIGAPVGNYARVHSGADGHLLITLPGVGGAFGSAVAPAGDLNGDGHADLAVGAPGLNRVDVLSGADGALLRRYERLQGAFGSSLLALGDVDADGVGDFLVGAPTETVFGQADAGNVLVISGNLGTVLFKAPATAAGEHRGAAVAALGAGASGGAGPVPQPHLAAGAPGALGPNGEAGGAARLFDGALIGAIFPYGIGCPGSFLITPRLDVIGDPLPNGELTLSVTQGLGGSYALLFLGSAQGELPLANGCILWVDPLYVPPVTVPLSGDFPGNGEATVVGRLPPSTPPGMVITVQTLIADKGTDGGVSSTSAFRITVL